MKKVVNQQGLRTWHLSSEILHHGPSLQEGHYTTNVRLPSGKWVWCNDRSVSEERGEGEVVILHYVRDNLVPVRASPCGGLYDERVSKACGCAI